MTSTDEKTKSDHGIMRSKHLNGYRGKQCMIDPDLHRRLRGYARENTLHIRSVIEHLIEEFLDAKGF